VFEAGEKVKVVGRSKGKGFAGTVSRHGFRGGPKTHGHLERSGGKFRHLQEFKVSDLGDFEVGQEIKADVFEAGEKVKVVGRSKGKGFAGTVSRHGFRGGPKTHGQSDRHRAPGSIGAGTSPGRVWPGTRMPGHYGNSRVSLRGLTVVLTDAERNLILVKGGVPGPKNGIVRIQKQGPS
jgi:large subunit ribosomal protein L3